MITAAPGTDSSLLDSTNVYSLQYRQGAPTGLPTPPSDHKRIRQLEFDGRDKKRLRLASPRVNHGRGGADTDCEPDDDDEDKRRRAPSQYSVYSLRNRGMLGLPSSRHFHLPTRSVLQSFVSSHKTDVFKCDSIDPRTFITLPYACSYSHAAKRGGTPHLAVATEQGTVHIMNTGGRRDWDPEPQRESLQPHLNGIFDVQWSPSDTLIATASGDQSVRITTLASSVPSSERTVNLLRGHHSTVKCVAWDPTHDGSVLCAGGRDGSICLWDMRVGEAQEGPEGTRIRLPVLSIAKAHDSDDVKSPKPKGRGRKKLLPAAPLKSITHLLYTESHPYGIVSSSSFDGLLNLWDFRLPRYDTPKMPTKTKIAELRPRPLVTSSCDPTAYGSTRRARGITTLAAGSGPTAGLLYALGTDSRVHTYAAPSLEPLSGYSAAELGTRDPHAHTHPTMQTNSFYVRLAASPCGRWLASGNASDGRAYLYDVASAASAARARDAARSWSDWNEAVELTGHTGEVGAMDWADGMLATCGDDGTVRVWRPNGEVSQQCLEQPEEMKWTWTWTLETPPS